MKTAEEKANELYPENLIWQPDTEMYLDYNERDRNIWLNGYKYANQEKESVEVELWRCTNNKCQIEQTIDHQLCIHCDSEIKPIVSQEKESS